MDKLKDKDRIEVVLKTESHEIDAGEEEISLRQIIQALIKGKRIIAVAVAASLLLAVAGLYFTTPYKGVAKIMISLNFDGIEKGLDPHGQKFDLGKIKAPVVTSRVVEALELGKYGITPDDLRRNLTISPVVPGEIVAKIANMKESIEKGKESIKILEEYVYYPSDYIISFNIPKDKKISGAQAQEIVDGIINAYSDYFYEAYGDTNVLANAIDSLDYKEYDYPEVSIVMRNQIEIIKNYLAAKSKEADGFRSSKTGLAFNDILESVNIVDKVDINRMDSIIGAFKLTKDREKLIKSYEYAIKRFELDKAKKEDEAKIAADVMSKFEKDRNLLMLSGGDAASLSTVETEKPNPFYDDLAERSVNSGVAAASSAHDIEYYRREIEFFSAEDTIPAELKNKAEQEILALMENIKGKLEHWIAMTNETASEYYETQYYSKAILKLTPVEIGGANDKSRLVYAVALMLGLMAGIFAALFADYWKAGNSNAVKKAKNTKNRISLQEQQNA